MEHRDSDITLISSRTVRAEQEFCAATGFFDGVHRGHRFLLRQVGREAARRGLGRMAVTFGNSPRSVLRPGFRTALLTSPEEKAALLLDGSVDVCALLRFSRELAALPARDFMEKYLRDRLRVRCLVVGYDHRFGSDRMAGFEDYVAYGRGCGIEVVRAGVFENSGSTVSSSSIRQALSAGDVEAARSALGRPYALSGTVEEGRHMGRVLGFPTANLRPSCPDKLVPASGVYAVRAEAGGRFFGGMLNIGSRPTLRNGSDRTIETHLFDFSGNLYGEPLTLYFEHRLRDERPFATLEELSRQLARDAEQARKLLSLC